MDLKDFIINNHLYGAHTRRPDHTPTHSSRIPRLLYEENEPCEQACTTALLFKRMSTEWPIESGCILRQRKCRPLPEPPVRRWSITALVTAACATSHMIPTVPPLFRKSNSCEWKERGFGSSPLPSKCGDKQNRMGYRTQRPISEPLPPAA